ncbi:MAG: ferrous iron transport protein A [Magnetococcales bacterium]|nr:ferrous iron transport protein A [Magnetococcales bacterium]
MKIEFLGKKLKIKNKDAIKALEDNSVISLKDLLPGDAGIVLDVVSDTALRLQLTELGFTSGARVAAVRAAPLGDPRAFELHGSRITLGNEESKRVAVVAVNGKSAGRRLVALTDSQITLKTLLPGDEAVVHDVAGDHALRLQLMELGFMPGARVRAVRSAPLGDPRAYELHGTRITLGNEEAGVIIMETAENGGGIKNKEIPLSESQITLKQLKPGKEATVHDVAGSHQLRLRLMEMGFIPGTAIKAVRSAPLGDPKAYEIHGSRITLGNDEAEAIVMNTG